MDEVLGLEAIPRLRCIGKQSLKLQDLDVKPGELMPLAQQLLKEHEKEGDGGSEAGDGFLSDEEFDDPLGHGGALD